MPELCASCREFSSGVLRDLCPECRNPEQAKVICHKQSAECLTCQKCKREEAAAP